MARPSPSDLREVLTDQDWHWTPPFKAAPLKIGEVGKVVTQYYAAVDEHIEKYEKGSPKADLLTTQQSWDTWKQHARKALMTYTHGGMRQPFGVRHRAFLQKWTLLWLFGKSSNMYYFAVAWQFNEWRDHILEVYYDAKHRRIEGQHQRASKRIQGTPLTAESKDVLEDAVAVHLAGEEIGLPKDELDSFTGGDMEEEFHYGEELLEVWLDLHGIPLDSSGKSDVIGYTFNRYRNDTSLRRGLSWIVAVLVIVVLIIVIETSGFCDTRPGQEPI
jgi:hypothetical protein